MGAGPQGRGSDQGGKQGELLVGLGHSLPTETSLFPAHELGRPSGLACGPPFQALSGEQQGWWPVTGGGWQVENLHLGAL